MLPEVTPEQFISILAGFIASLLGSMVLIGRWLVRRLFAEKKVDEHGKVIYGGGFFTRMVDKHVEFVDRVEDQGERALALHGQGIALQSESKEVLTAIHDSQSRLVVLSAGTSLGRTNTALVHLAEAIYAGAPDDKRSLVKPHTDAIRDLLSPREDRTSTTM